ncbi:hypothetical protein Hgul01_00552 [Herpetosiphon gulosus]|uniref:Insertion element IS402-like domain-containing protein n=1 Tax=Herpetosiphon gulosus TaxID=1973496 RepID=A0ABP9WU91_9CHLR
MAVSTDLTDDEWAAIAPFLPPLPRRADGRGRPWVDSRAALTGILWVLQRAHAGRTCPRAIPLSNLPSPLPTLGCRGNLSNHCDPARLAAF